MYNKYFEQLNNLNEDYLCEMANVSKEDTGLPYDLWIDSEGKDRKTQHSMPRLKVDVNGDRIPVSIEQNPKILADKEIPKFARVKKYIQKYYNVFIKHWNKELTDKQALNLLNK